MTALKEYARLESGGIWRESPDKAAREVIVSFGDATLVVSDGSGSALTHWSLPAVTRLNAGTRPALFAPDTDADETLEIEDPLMIDAIEKVRKTIARTRPRPRKLRHLSTVLIIGTLAAAGVFWFPGALREQTLSAVPQSKRAEIGATVLGHIQFLTGPSCRGPQGRQALAQLHRRLLGRDADGQIIVAPTGFGDAVGLPGGIIVLDKSIPESTDDPAITAGYVLAAHTTRTINDPLAPILETAGLRGTFTLFTTGELAPEVLKTYAQSLVDGALPPRDPVALVQSFDAARLSTTPFATHLASHGAPMPYLIANDPVTGDDVAPIMGDGAWVSLQGICDT
ncbi:hypothetical protein SAMN04488515_0444 [Cognatiyoonia koreensis]|uniref:Uncharacterized protein n=1 Tax=Cognatiyoonia koreensis TaxID=364200 RepID=A0A1I0N868_9RHOB|nr:hypothetical protein [Cognatiyoonia koreensis]SEV96870.1 hypothetical protein SAMN04488515_0444 [Cognatiyoonia koreensis]